MNVDGVPYRSIWVEDDGVTVAAIDQTRLPHDFRVLTLATVGDVARAIHTMQVRGAPLIGATAAYGVALAMHANPSIKALREAVRLLRSTRPTAVNLSWALDRMAGGLADVPPAERCAAAYALAGALCDEDVEINRALGRHGLGLIRSVAEGRAGGPVRVQTHCNAGWLATVDWGTATAPIYMAHDQGIPVHVWVDETRPRSQGARLTAWELGRHGVPHTVVPDAAAAHLMRTGQVDMVLVGTDRTTASGDVANKIGTYPLALAAADNGVPFYVAAPSPSIDWTLEDGSLIPIEERSADEVTRVGGRAEDGEMHTVTLVPEGTRAVNYAFDVTPARLVTGIITERGVVAPDGLREAFRDVSGAWGREAGSGGATTPPRNRNASSTAMK